MKVLPGKIVSVSKRVTNLPQFAWNFPGFSNKNPVCAPGNFSVVGKPGQLAFLQTVHTGLETGERTAPGPAFRKNDCTGIV